MSNYTKTTNFGAKDTLPSGDSQKIIRGTEFDTEFNAISTAIATKLEVDGSNNLAISGTFSATKLIPTGGSATGNGMYLPAANAVAISTNGTERLRIDSSGVASFASNPILSGGTANGLVYLDGSKVATSGSAVTFDGTNFATTGTASATKLIPTGGTATGNGLYLPATNTVALSTNGTERLRVDSSGNLGIGTNSPSYKLDVSTISIAVSQSGSVRFGASSDQYGMRLNQSTTAGGAPFAQIMGPKDANGWIAFTTGAADAERMRLDSSGRLLIGTTTGTDTLTTQGSVAFNVNGTTDVFKHFSGGSGLVYAGTTTSTAIAFITNGAERMRLGASGYLGIGTSSPAYQLDIVGNIRLTNATGIYFNNSSGTAKTILQYFSDNNTYLDSPDGNTLFRTGSGTVERMRLDASGTLGIGVTPSAWSGGFKATQYPGGSVASYASGTNLQIEVGNAYYQSSLGTYTYYNTGTAPTLYRQISGEHRWLIAPSGTAGNAITFTQAMTLDASGDLGVGETSPGGYRLAVKTSGTALAFFRGAEYSQVRHTDGTRTLFTQVYNNVAVLATESNTPLTFGTNNTERMRLDSSGNWALGTTATNLGKAYIYTNDASLPALGVRQDGVGPVQVWANFGTERMRLKSTGQLRFVPLASDPAGAEAGDVYYNSTSNKLKVYNGTAWADLH